MKRQECSVATFTGRPFRRQSRGKRRRGKRRRGKRRGVRAHAAAYHEVLLVVRDERVRHARGVVGERRVAEQHLKRHHAEGPPVDLVVVRRGAVRLHRLKHLGRDVVGGADGAAANLAVEADLRTRAKVRQLHVPEAVEQNVVRFHIAARQTGEGRCQRGRRRGQGSMWDEVGWMPMSRAARTRAGIQGRHQR